jgi:hypothetical protein
MSATKPKRFIINKAETQGIKESLYEEDGITLSVLSKDDMQVIINDLTDKSKDRSRATTIYTMKRMWDQTYYQLLPEQVAAREINRLALEATKKRKRDEEGEQARRVQMRLDKEARDAADLQKLMEELDQTKEESQSVVDMIESCLNITLGDITEDTEERAREIFSTSRDYLSSMCKLSHSKNTVVHDAALEMYRRISRLCEELYIYIIGVSLLLHM